MTAESTLKFGPEWLRALSQGNGTTTAVTSSSPPSSPEIPKYKLAEYRYGREEMLALFSKDIKMPRELKQFNGLSREVCQMPMALIEFTEEEQKLWSRSVNSEAVLRLMGRGATTVAGPPAHRGGRGGGSVDRGRGRGRATYYQRGLSSEDLDLPTPGGLTRQRSYERSNSERGSGWEEGERKYDKPFSVRDEEVGLIRKDGLSTSLDWRSGNLRSTHSREPEDESGRKLGVSRTDKWGRSNWRSEREERHADSGPDWSGNSRTSYRKPTSGHVRLRDDDFNGEGDSLPEWSMEDNKDAEKVGTFDATGAFLETKEEKDGENAATERTENVGSPANSHSSSDTSSSSISQDNSTDISNSSSSTKAEMVQETTVFPAPTCAEIESEVESAMQESEVLPEYPVIQSLPSKVESDPVPEMPPLIVPQELIIEKKEDVNFEHLEKAAESLVDAIEDDEKVEVDEPPNLVNSWYYRDPQGVIQGPFTDFEMTEWYRTGYFDLGLMVRQGVKGRFCTLGDLASMRNSMPFMPSQPINGEPAPIPRPTIAAAQPLRGLVGGLSNHAAVPLPHQFDLVNDQEQHMRFIQQQMLHQRLLQQQYQQQQQRFTRQPLQQLLGGGNPVDNLAATLSSNPQHYYIMQKLMAQQHQPPGGLTRNPNLDSGNVHDPVRQLAAQLAATQPSISLKEDGPSLWNLPAASAIASRGGHNVGVGWRPKSVWDLDSGSVGHEKLLAANLMQTEQQLLEEQKKKRAAEEDLLRIQREEEERRRRLQEEQEQHERLRLEELRLREREEEERREKEELLKKQQLELEERKRKESEERRCREEEERRLKEEQRLREEQLRKQEEERRKQEEFFIFQQKEQQRLEELKRKEKRRQMEEEEKIKAEHQREQLEMKLRQAEALKKLQEKQKIKQGPAWGGTAPTLDNALSLVEIQRIQEEKEQQEKLNREIQQQLLLQQQLQAQISVQQQQARSVSNMTWAERSNVAVGPVKSLLEIQKEEAEKLAQQKEKQTKLQQQQQQQTANNNITLSTAGVWSSSSAHLRQTNNSTSSFPWNTESAPNHTTNGGVYFWDDQPASTNKSKGQSWPTNAKNQETHSTSNGQTSKPKTTRAKKEEEAVMKLFETPKSNVDEFTEWCIQALSDLQATIDVPTFVSFLKDVESPYEVHDYVRQYLGEGKEVHNFTKQFLENRSKYRHQARKNQVEENMWGPARAINPSLSKPQTIEMDGFKTSAGKKKKKNKMQKVDSTILGFTVHAAMDRINIGDIDHGEDI